MSQLPYVTRPPGKQKCMAPENNNNKLVPVSERHHFSISLLFINEYIFN